MAYGSGRRRVEAHEKSMGSYRLHAWRDAMAIASLLDEMFDVAKARAIFESVDKTDLIKYEGEVSTLLAEFIKKPERQRPAIIKKLHNDERTRVAFLSLAMIGCVRAMKVMDLRDDYRYALTPGAGNRETTAAIYTFSMAVTLAACDYSWPSDVISSMGLHDEEDDEDSTF